MNDTVIHVQLESFHCVYRCLQSHTTHSFATIYYLATSFDPVKEGSRVKELGNFKTITIRI